MEFFVFVGLSIKLLLFLLLHFISLLLIVLKQFGTTGCFSQLPELSSVVCDRLILRLQLWDVLLDKILFGSSSAFIIFAGEDLILILKASEFVGVGGVVFAIVLGIEGILIQLKVFS